MKILLLISIFVFAFSVNAGNGNLILPKPPTYVEQLSEIIYAPGSRYADDAPPSVLIYIEEQYLTKDHQNLGSLSNSFEYTDRIRHLDIIIATKDDPTLILTMHNNETEEQVHIQTNYVELETYAPTLSLHLEKAFDSHFSNYKCQDRQ